MSETLIAPSDRQEAFDPDGVLVEAFLLYREAGLYLPPVPRELARRLDELAEWQFGSAPADLTDRAAFLAEAARPDAGTSVAFGHAGHGLASWFLCYRLIRGPLAVFIRQRFGGPYDNEDVGRFIVNRTAQAIEALVVAADGARASGLIAAGQRLAVLVDDVEGSGWHMLGGESRWQPSESAITDALVALTARH